MDIPYIYLNFETTMMYKFLIGLLFVIIIPGQLKSQILPKEGALLHYRLIGFSVAIIKEVSNYKIEIAKGYFSQEEPFKKNIIQSLNGKNNKNILEVPSFGCQYTWRVVYSIGKSEITKSGFHHFSTLMDPKVDTAITRCRIIKPAANYKDAYVFYDGTRTLYDMNGHPVWYLPSVKGLRNDENVELCDIKLSPAGTITFILGDQACEINYNGEITWKAPDNGIVSGDSIEHYHHEFTRLNNGHYMAIGNEFTLFNNNPSSPKDSILQLLYGKKVIRDSLLSYMKRGYMQMPFGTIIEYNEKGDVVWFWKLSKYFRETEVDYYKPPALRGGFEPHQNSFFFDEKNQAVYISLRNLSRIIKVKYPEGNVINNYGLIYKNNVPIKGDDLFCQQHSPRISRKGNLYLFNNNSCNESEAIPKITILQEPASDKEKLKKIWEYDCAAGGDFKKTIATGGNVVELPDQSMFVCMGKQYGTTFIVSPDKKILWSAIPETWNADKNKWEMIPQYRASIISSRKELEQLIWNDEQLPVPAPAH